MKSTFKDFYNKIIKEDTKDIDTEAKKKSKKQTATTEKPVDKVELPVEDSVEDTTGVKTLEKDFLNKFIRYNELQFLMKDLPEIVNSFKSIQGFDEQLIRDTVEKLLKERQTEIDTLTKDLTELRDKITKEAEIANYKKSIIDVFNNQASELSNRGDSKYAYGYQAKDNGEDYNTGATLAGKDGVPTVSAGMPEVTDNGDPALDPVKQDAEELPDDPTQPAKIDDLKQAEELDADALTKEPQNILIDSKKKKKSKKK